MLSNVFFFINNVVILAKLTAIFWCETIKYICKINTFDKCIDNIIQLSIKQNILFVKVIQALSSEKSLSDTVITVLKKNTHSVGYEQEELNDSLIEMIKNKYAITLYEDKPFHSGMVSVAYKGELRDGQKVVIKILRKNIKSRIRQGSENIAFLYYVLSWFSIIIHDIEFKDKLEILKSIINTTEYLVGQCNFDNEIMAINTSILEKNKTDICKNIIIPKVFNNEEDICNTKFIILEFLDGKFPVDIKDIDKREQYLKMFILFSFMQMYYFTYLHSDLHNGNIICMEDEAGNLKLGIIDYGMNIKVTKEIKRALIYFSEQIFSNSPKLKNLSSHIDSFIINKINMNEISLENIDKTNVLMYELFKSIKSGILNEAVLHKVFGDIAILLNLKQFELNMDFILILLSLSMMQGCINYLSNYDKKISEKIFTEVYLEIME